MSLRMPRRRGPVVLITLAVLGASVYFAVAVLRQIEQRDRPRNAQRLADAMGVVAGSTIAEVGAGDGAMAIEMARIVGPRGAVIATEMTEAQLERIRQAARRAGARNVSVRLAGVYDSNLPAGCCNAVYMQRVYHHLTDPAPVMASIARSLKPGGRVAILEFEPGWIANWSTPPGVPNRGGHGVPRELLVSEMAGHRFEATAGIQDFGWELYLGVFRKAQPEER